MINFLRSLSGLQNRIYVHLILPGIKTLETQHKKAIICRHKVITVWPLRSPLTRCHHGAPKWSIDVAKISHNMQDDCFCWTTDSQIAPNVQLSIVQLPHGKYPATWDGLRIDRQHYRHRSSRPHIQ